MMKKLIILIAILACGVGESMADPYKIMGDFTSWTYSDSEWTMTQNTTQTNLWTYVKKGWKATKANIEYKAYANSGDDTWIPSGVANKTAYFTVNEVYDLLFILNISDKTLKLVSSVNISGSFNSWTNNALTMSDDGTIFTGTISSVTSGSEFGFRVCYNNDSSDDAWFGYTSGATLSTNDGAIYDSGESNHNFTFSNIANGYTTFDVKATWNPSSGHTSTASAWTFEIKPGTVNGSASKIVFSNPDNWTTVHAYYYNSNDDKEKEWPGYQIAKVDGFYTFFYQGEAKSYIIFNNNGSGIGNQYPVEGGYSVANNKVYGSSNEVTVNIPAGSYGYSTFSSEYPLDFTSVGDELRAYRATWDNTNKRVVMTRLSGTVPANTGLFIAGTAGASANVPAIASASAIGTNLMKPTTGSDIYDGGKYQYIFSRKNEELGFYKLASNYSPAKGKAYLESDTELTSVSAPSLSIFFDDAAGGTTAIDAVKSAEPAVTDGAYYNLAGQRVTNPTKGLYIVNGRKVVVK